MNKIFAAIIFCIVVCAHPAAQAKLKMHAVNSPSDGNGKSSYYNLLTNYDSIFTRFEYSNPDSSVFYMKQGLAYFTTHLYKPGIAGMLANLGGIYSTQGMLEISKKATEDALKIYEGLNNKIGIANSNNILGVVEGRKSNYAAAVDHFLTALKIYEELGDTSGITDTYIKLGAANEYSNNLDKALDYYNKGLSLLDTKTISDNLIFLNNNIGDIYFTRKDYKQAIKYFQIALEESKDKKYAQIHMLPLENIADVYRKMGDKAKAMQYSQEALEIALKEHLREDYARILVNLAEINSESDPALALSQLDEALQTAKNIGERSLQSGILNSIIAIHEKKGDYKTALVLLKQQKNLSDSILNLDNERTMANLEAMYDLDKLNSKVQQLEFSQQEQQQKKNGILIISGLMATFLVVLSFFLWNTKTLNAKLVKREIGLENASRVKNKLISIIAHDIIGSIRFMPVALGLCREESIPVEERKALFMQVEQNAVASYETLKNMLDWGKSQIQGITLNQKEVNVNEICCEVLNFSHIYAKTKQIAIENSIGEETTVFADPDHVRFIFRNLVSNAIKYTNKNGRIAISSAKSADGSRFVFSIRDNGVGIPADKKQNIFDSFGDSLTGTDNEKGNGIGLQLCKEFALKNGGEIWVESEVNNGSTFYFSMKASA